MINLYSLVSLLFLVMKYSGGSEGSPSDSRVKFFQIRVTSRFSQFESGADCIHEHSIARQNVRKSELPSMNTTHPDVQPTFEEVAFSYRFLASKYRIGMS